MKRRKSTHANQIGPGIPPDPLHQLGRFWLYLLGGGLLWGLLLLLGSARFREPYSSAEVPMWLQSTYFAGLYLWLSILTVFFRPKVWPRWKPCLSKALLGYSLGGLLLLAFWLVFGFSIWLQFSPPALSGYQLLHAVLLGWLVAIIEEAVFRGLHLELLAQRYSKPVAVSSQALLYAVLHLLSPQHVNLTGLIALGGLFAVGCCLGLLRLCTGNLALGTGLHAGWISLSMLGAWSECLNWSSEAALWSGQGNPAQGLSGLICFALLSAWIWHLLPQKRQLWHNEAKRQ